MKVLIIDDDQCHGQSLVDLLTARGHDAFHAGSYVEAEWLSGLFRFDLSIIDLEMEPVRGPEAARRLRERSPDLDVVIVSGHAGGERRRTEIAEEIGDLPYFPKPIETEAFLAFLEGIFSRRRGSPLMVRESFPLEQRGPGPSPGSQG